MELLKRAFRKYLKFHEKNVLQVRNSFQNCWFNMENMKSTVLYHYYRPERRNGLCRSFNARHCAITSAIYSLVSFFLPFFAANLSTRVIRNFHSFFELWFVNFVTNDLILKCFRKFIFIQKKLCFQNISMLVVLLYSWQINVNTKKFHILADVYYGVQISYFAIIGSHLSIILLSVVLILGINTVSKIRCLMLKVLQ